MTYYVTKSGHSSQHVLVDRRAHGRVVGKDVRLIITYPDRKVDTSRVDNHQIFDIPLVNAGGVITSITGEVIVIMH